MFKVIKKQHRKTNSWSGGITQELYIYPEDASYEKKDFKFRISIATTENEQSTFTKFPHAKRIISVLENRMTLVHKDHYSVSLERYDIDRFSGDWETSSQGKVTDFNLIIQNGEGDFFYTELMTGNELAAKSNAKAIHFIFCIEGSVSLKGHDIGAGELAVTDDIEIPVKSKHAKIFYGHVEIEVEMRKER